MAKTYIKFWDSYESYFEQLSDAEVGRLVRGMLKYKSRGVEPEFSGSERFIWPAIKRELDEDATYTEKKSKAGKLGGAPLENDNAEKETSKNKQKQAGHRTKDKGLRTKDMSSSSNDDSSCLNSETTTTRTVADVFRDEIGKLSATCEKELDGYAVRIGDETVLAVIKKCADMGGKTWAYVRKALDEAEQLGCKTAAEYAKNCPIGSGRGTRVTRKTPVENDFLAGITLNQSLERLKRKGEKA